MPVTLAIATLATFYNIDITGIIVWTIISACNASYILPRVYNELLILPYRYIPGIINLCFCRIVAMHIIV